VAVVSLPARGRPPQAAARRAGLDTAVALWIAAGANPKEVSTRAGHAR
jgi:hypothetical protein